MNHRNRQNLLVLLVVLLVTGCDPAPDVDSDGASIDVLERQLEIGRHELFVSLKSDADSTLAGFTTDGCSGGLTIGWEYLAGKIENFQSQHGMQPAWEACCVAHDRRYHTGGSGNVTANESFNLRKQADLVLRDCVTQTGTERIAALNDEYGLSVDQVEVLYDTIAGLMYRAVRIGGVPCSGLPWRWGYGWPACE